MLCTIYVLRHEQRDLTNPLFDTPLTTYGSTNASGPLLDLLEKKEINVIYCSPFNRCLDTIAPYANKFNIPVIVDYNLYEWVCHPLFKNHVIGEVNKEKYQFVKEIRNSDISILYPESSESRLIRVNSVTENIITTHCEKNSNILICSHMDILHDIIKYVVPCWPRGYISMGTLLNLNSLKYTLNHTIKLHALITNLVINCVRHMYIPLYTVNHIISLKEKVQSVTKSVYNDFVNVRLSALWRKLDENEGNRRNND